MSESIMDQIENIQQGNTGNAKILVVGVGGGGGNAVQNMIRDGKLHQLDSTMQTSSAEGMYTMDTYLQKLYNDGKITKETALVYSSNYDNMAKKLG